ncbi:hypothetical protein PM082_014443 [Marasmius tenuissimus]|nr:hypothetical protein PM082_014443 [Marasmius tenuissimus]
MLSPSEPNKWFDQAYEGRKQATVVAVMSRRPTSSRFHKLINHLEGTLPWIVSIYPIAVCNRQDRVAKHTHQDMLQSWGKHSKRPLPTSQSHTQVIEEEHNSIANFSSSSVECDYSSIDNNGLESDSSSSSSDVLSANIEVVAAKPSHKLKKQVQHSNFYVILRYLLMTLLHRASHLHQHPLGRQLEWWLQHPQSKSCTQLSNIQQHQHRAGRH